MDRRRAAGALLALAACIACSAAAPTASNHTALDLYEGAPEGCYYNFQHYGEGDRIMTNEPCLNCTCHNRMLMCYLRVCPFTKAIGQDCTVEKRADQCCPIVTCPDVPVDLLTSTSTTSPAEYGATGLGKLDKYGCSISGKYFPEGSKVPPTPNKPCEHCYCIRNMTTCVMQECTLHVDGCTPIYHKDVCCPVRYSCDHPEDEVPLLDDMSTTVRPTPGFLLTTTTMAPVTQMTQDCVHDDQVFADGALIKTEKACEHCYCMKGDIVCVVQECGAPMENEGKNCTSLPPREGQCCPDTYICDGDELPSDLPTESVTDTIVDKPTTLSPPRRTNDEGSGYRNEPDEVTYTEMPVTESEVEGSGDDQETSKPLDPNDMIPGPEDGEQYIYVTTKAPTYEEHELTTAEIDRNVTPASGEQTEQPHIHPSSTITPVSEESEKLTTSSSGLTEEDVYEPHKYASTTSAPETFESITTELGESLNTVPDETAEPQVTKAQDYAPGTTTAPTSVESESLSPVEGGDDKPSIPEEEKDVTATTLLESTKPEYSTPSSGISDDTEKEISTSIDISNVTPEVMTEYSESDISGTTVSSGQEIEKESVPVGDKDLKPELTTSNPLGEDEKSTTEVDHAQNTVAVSEEETPYPHSHLQTTTIAPTIEEEVTTVSIEKDIVTDKDLSENVIIPHASVTTASPNMEETEPDRGMNTIPSETNEESSSESSLAQRTTTSLETKETEETHSQDLEIKSTTSAEIATLSPESMTTKVDQSTITTEPSFRKEDDITVSTEKPKETEQTTVKSEFVDEGLIPTSSHDEKTDTSSKAPSIEEEFTTSIPEYVTEISETTGLKETTVPTQDSIVTVKESESSHEQDGDLPSSTEKLMEVTPFHEENVDIQEEPSRIPGEGDCLLNGITYRNNSVVPSTNNCHTGCRCASSIIKCDPIICSPPPDYMDNCQSIYDSPDSCCPTYVCDHPRETVPPQSDNQMSGTESPMPSPTIECRGDQCEISQPTKQPIEQFDLKPTSKPEIECGSEGCSDGTHKPDSGHTSGEQSEKCPGGKCEVQGCTNSECDLPQTEGQVSPAKPCEGEHCEKIDEVISESPQLCKNEKDCRPLEIPVVSGAPCQGESCEKVDSHVSPSEKPYLCKDNDDCKTQDIPDSDCSGDEPCRRKETTTTDEKIPSACEGTDCVHEQVTTVFENVDTSSTELPKIDQTPFKEITEMPGSADEEKVTEIPDSPINKPKDEKVPMEETDNYTTESQTGEAITVSEKEKPVNKDDATDKPLTPGDVETESPAISDETDKNKPSDEAEITTKPATESLDVIESGTTESAIAHEKGEEPVIMDSGTEKPALPSDDGEKEPVINETDATPKPTMVEQGTESPTVATEVDTDKIATVDVDFTEKPFITEYYPDAKGETTITPSVVEEESSSKPATGERTTDAPAIVDQESTSEPVLVVDTDKPSFVDSNDKEKPDIIDTDSTKKPSEADEGTDKPITDEDQNKPATVITEETYVEATDKPAYSPDVTKEESTVKPLSIDEQETAIDSEKEITEQPTLTTETDTKIPEVVDKESDKEPPISSSDDKDETAITDGGVEKPTPTEDEKMKPEVVGQEETEKPSTVHEDGEDKPSQENDGQKETTEISQDNTEKPILVDVVEPEKPLEVEDEHKEKPDVVLEDKTESPYGNEEKSSVMPQTSVDEGTEEPITVEKDTERPTFADNDDKQKPTLAPEDEKDTSGIIEPGMKEKPAIEKESTELPVTVTEAEVETETEKLNLREDDLEKPTTINTSIKPPLPDEESTLVPDVLEDKNTVKPTIFDEGTEEPTISIKEDTTEGGDIENETTELPSTSEEVDTKKPMIIDEDAELKPGITVDISTEEPITDEKTTYKPSITEEEDMIKPTISEGQPMDKESSDKPYVPQEESTATPTVTKEVATDKPVLIDEEGNVKPVDEEQTEHPDLVKETQDKPKDEDKPAIIDEEVTDRPAVNEGETTESIYGEEGSGSEAPIIPQTSEPNKEEEVIHEIEKSTKTPSYDTQTTLIGDKEHELSTDSNIIGTEAPEKKVTQYEDNETNEPTDKLTSSDHSLGSATETPLSEQELTTQAFNVPEQEKVTINDQGTEGTTHKYDIIDTKGDEASTTRRDLIEDEVSSSTKDPQLYETPVSVQKTTETAIIEDASVATEMAGIESPTTSPPDDVQPEKPKQPSTTEMEEESTTKLYDEGTVKPIPESHVTETSSTAPEYSTSAEVTEVSKVKDEDEDKDKTEPELPEEHSMKPEGYSTQLPIDSIKTDYPEVHSSEKDTTTDSPLSSATEPERRYTEVEDPSVTGPKEITTGYPEHATEPQVSTVTEKIHESTDIDEVSSEKPLSTDSDGTSEEPEKITESEKPVTESSEMGHHTSEIDTKKPLDEFESLTTEIPTATVTETQDISNISPEKDVTISEEKTTVTTDISDHTEKETIPVEEYTEKQESSSEVPHRHTTEAQEIESYATESSETTEKHVTTETLAKATDVPNVSEKEEVTVTEEPEVINTEPQDLDKKEQVITEKQEQPTELPTPIEDERTESSGGKVTTDVPLSLVTEHKDSLGEPTTESNLPKEQSSKQPDLLTTQSEESHKEPEHYDGQEDTKTERPVEVTESVEVTTKIQEDRITEVSQEALPEAQDTKTTLRESHPVTEGITKIEGTKPTEPTFAQTEFSETTPYLIELEEHTHKIQEEITTVSQTEDHTDKPVEESSSSSHSEEDIPTSPSPSEDDTPKVEKQPSTVLPFEEKYTTIADVVTEQDLITRISDEGFETATKPADTTTKASEEVSPVDVSEKVPDSIPVKETTLGETDNERHTTTVETESTSAPVQVNEESTPTAVTESSKEPVSESDIAVATEKEIISTEKPEHPIVSHETTTSEEEFIFSTSKATTERQEEDVITPASVDKFEKPSEKPSQATDIPPSSTTTEISKPSVSDLQPTDEIPVPDEFPPSGTSGYGEPDYVEEDQAFGPGTCRYGGKVYVSAQQIPRDDPCDFCFCFRSDIICLQQSCPPPIHGCHEEPIQGFCCPRYECPVSMATTVNVTTTTTTTTTTLPPHFPTHSYKGAAHRRGCQIKGHTYKVGEVVRSSSGPCLHCTCGGDGQMKCDPKACTPEPMLRQMIAAAVSAKRRR